MFELKPLSIDAIPKALERADRYRLLNEPAEAESICLDILAADPENQRALVTLILALTDQFGESGPDLGGDRCEQYIASLSEEYERVYYTGVMNERRANGRPGLHHVLARVFKDLMPRYQTMKGKFVMRKGGWDTHGLPVELGVEKELGITKEDIGKKISVEEYNQKCREAVLRFPQIELEEFVCRGWLVFRVFDIDAPHPVTTGDQILYEAVADKAPRSSYQYALLL